MIWCLLVDLGGSSYGLSVPDQPQEGRELLFNTTASCFRESLAPASLPSSQQTSWKDWRRQSSFGLFPESKPCLLMSAIVFGHGALVICFHILFWMDTVQQRLTYPVPSKIRSVSGPSARRPQFHWRGGHRSWRMEQLGHSRGNEYNILLWPTGRCFPMPVSPGVMPLGPRPGRCTPRLPQCLSTFSCFLFSWFIVPPPDLFLPLTLSNKLYLVFVMCRALCWATQGSLPLRDWNTFMRDQHKILITIKVIKISQIPNVFYLNPLPQTCKDKWVLF